MAGTVLLLLLHVLYVPFVLLIVLFWCLYTDCARDADAQQSHVAAINKVLIADSKGAAQRKNSLEFGRQTAEKMTILSLAWRSKLHELL